MTQRNDSKSSYRVPTENNNNDDFDIIAIFLQLWNGKKTILISMVFFLSLCILYLFLAKEKWTSSAIVTQPSAGQVANYNAALAIIYSQSSSDKPSVIDLQKQLFNRFNASISALSSSLANLEVPLQLKVEQLNKGSDDSFTISFAASTAKEAQAELTGYITKINKEVVEDYGDDIKLNLGVKANELTNVLDTHRQTAINKKKNRIDVMKQALKVAQESGVQKSTLSQADYLSDDTLYLLGSNALNAMIENESTKPLEFDDSYYTAERALLAVTHLKVQVGNLQSFRYISTPDLPIKRDSPKRSLLLVLSLVLGLIFGAAIIIIRNIVVNYRKEY